MDGMGLTLLKLQTKTPATRNKCPIPIRNVAAVVVCLLNLENGKNTF